MKGSYTVEASWIMSITLCILCATILIAFQIYQEVIGQVKTPIVQVDTPTLFYQKTWIKEFMEGIK